MKLDALDLRLLELLQQHPRVGVLELSRLAAVARATVTARIARMESNGVITGHGPQIDQPDVVNARMLSFMEDVDSLDPAAVDA